MLLRICSALSLDEDSPNGEGSMLRYFLGDEDDGDTGMHLRLLGDVGLMSGSKSMVLFKVAPHAMTSGEGGSWPAAPRSPARVVVKVVSQKLK